MFLYSLYFYFLLIHFGFAYHITGITNNVILRNHYHFPHELHFKRKSNIQQLYLLSNIDDIQTLQLNSYLLLSSDIVLPIHDILMKSVDAGISGAKAASIQVLSLMWLRTAMNYQYRYSTSMINTIKFLYNEGGVNRLYQGLGFALIQSPASRFGDTASNILLLSLFNALDSDDHIPLYLKTILGSLTASLWRIFIMPIDTVKTCLQVYGQEKGWEIINQRLKNEGISSMYSGSIAASLATFVGHYPWFLVYNVLSENLPTSYEGIYQIDPNFLTLLRSAFIGLCASTASDTISNSFRVLKTSKQTISSNDINTGEKSFDTSYFDIINKIIKEDGITTLLTRGLQVCFISI